MIYLQDLLLLKQPLLLTIIKSSLDSVGQIISYDDDNKQKDELERLIQWAKDATRLLTMIQILIVMIIKILMIISFAGIYHLT